MRYLLTLSLILLIGLAVQAGELVTYQGRLTDISGNPVANGAYQLTFSLWSDSTGGTQLWSETHTSVNIANGLFGVNLGKEGGLDASYFETEPLFLQIGLVGGDIISPRTRLTSAPSAVAAKKVAGDIETGEGYLNIKSANENLAFSIITADKGPAYLRMYNPDPGFPEQTLLQLSSEFDGGGINFYPAGDMPSDPSIKMGVEPTPFRPPHMSFYAPSGSFPHDPCIRMGVEPSPFRGYLELYDTESGLTDHPMVKMGVEPTPFHKGYIAMYNPEIGPPPKMMEMEINDESGDWESYFNMYLIHPPEYPSEKKTLSISNSFTDGASIRMFNPQPEPPAVLFEINTTATDGASIRMFNPQPEPPARLFDLSVNVAKSSNDIVMALTDGDSTYQTRLSPGRVKVGHPTNDYYPRSELNAGADTVSFYLQGFSTFGSAPPIGMMSSSGEAKMGIGTIAPSEELHVVGDICYTGSIGACSDVRYKNNINTLTGALDKVSKMRGVSFNWRRDEYPENKFSDDDQIGFVAQELLEIYPQVVSEDDNGYFNVDYGKLTPLLVEAIKELKKQNEDLKNRIEFLETR